MDLDQILAVLHGWLGLEIEVSGHGSDGKPPLMALTVRGRLRSGDVLSRVSQPEVFLFVLEGQDRGQVGSFSLYAEDYAGGGWLGEDQEVLEVRSGSVQLLIAKADEDSSES